MSEKEITIEEIRRVEELVDHIVKAAKEYDIKMIHGYEDFKKNMLGVFIEDLEEQIKDRGKEKMVAKLCANCGGIGKVPVTVCEAISLTENSFCTPICNTKWDICEDCDGLGYIELKNGRTNQIGHNSQR